MFVRGTLDCLISKIITRFEGSSFTKLIFFDSLSVCELHRHKLEDQTLSLSLLKVTRQPGLAVPDRELDLILNLLRHLNMSEISS